MLLLLGVFATVAEDSLLILLLLVVLRTAGTSTQPTTHQCR
jgi:hypothetical protein